MKFELDGNELRLLVAATPAQRIQGLRGVDLSDCDGMAFVYERPTYQPFTMEGMTDPLDIVFIDEAQGILERAHLEPGMHYWPSKQFTVAIEMPCRSAQQCRAPVGLRWDDVDCREPTP